MVSLSQIFLQTNRGQSVQSVGVVWGCWLVPQRYKTEECSALGHSGAPMETTLVVLLLQVCFPWCGGRGYMYLQFQVI